MRIIHDIKILRSAVRQAKRKNKTIGFIPTMGALHEGHLSLIRRCRKDNDLTIISIFVNPAQFAPGEDLAAYPRQEKKDVLLAKNENVDIIFYPSVKMMYPDRYLTYIQVNAIADVLCGASRPSHFRGVATVVGKLLNIVTPDTLYLGQKDAQQCAVIKQMVRDLGFPTRVVVLPTVREKDGLAMSSRNAYLTPNQRREAAVLYQALCSAKKRARAGERKSSEMTRLIRSEIQKRTSGKIDYIACVDADSLTPLKILRGHMLIALAVKFGRARLIDNISLTVAAP